MTEKGIRVIIYSNRNVNFKTQNQNKMKKFILIAMISFVNTANAQLIKKIEAGAIFATSASTTFSGNSQPFEMGYGLSGSVAFLTDKTVHNFMYNFGGNSVAMLNAYFLPKNWDIYIVGSKSLNSNGGYLGCGIEKMEKIGNVKFFEFCELGTSFQGKPIFSFGLLVNVSWALKK